MMNAKKQFSLRFKLIAMSVSTLFLLGGAALGILLFTVNSQKKAIVDSYDTFSTSLADSISAQFYERYGDVQAFALNPQIQSHSKSTIVEMLNTYSALYGIYDLIMVVDSNGKLVAVSDKDPSGKPLKVENLYKQDYSAAPWFKSVIAGKFTEDKEKGFSGSFVEDPQLDPYMSEVFGVNTLGSSFSAPIKDSTGKTIGVISNRAGARWFEVAFKETYRNLKADHPTSRLKFFGKDGTLFYEYARDPKTKNLEESQYDWTKLLK